ncbi:ABC transporter permease [uncultured Methanobrevibacter sp.]|uniref:ABC transporter permease n=1 Tax=uncultured Methanobrevibacter sp. TaxID=253161 RepID=UPI002615031B|nr:ABC transporter permease [uncultured Methanobrevibacter sp.]
MITFIQTEFLKLKHTKIFLLTILGALSIPTLLYIGLLTGEYASFQGILDYCAIYACVLFYILLFTIMISYLFSREYIEHTLKTILTAPTPKTKILTGKYLVFFIWGFLIITITFIGTIFCAYFGGVQDISLTAGLNSYKEMLISGFLLCLSFSPLIFISLIMPNMVFSMISGAVFSIINLFIYSTQYSPYIPWCSPYIISSNEIFNYSCNLTTSLAIILITFAIGLIISYIYFTKKDVSL